MPADEELSLACGKLGKLICFGCGISCEYSKSICGGLLQGWQ